MRFSRFIVFLLLLSGRFLYGSDTDTWYKEQIARTTWNGWENKFYSCDSNGQIWVNNVSGEGTDVQKTKVFKLSFTPEQFKHFPLQDVNILAGWSNEKKIFYAIILDENDDVIQKEKLKIPDYIDDVEVRIGQGRRLALLFSGKEKDKYFIKLWFDERFQNIMIQNQKPDASFLHWAQLSIHYLYKEDVNTYWTVWNKGRFHSYELPFPVTTVQFIQWRNNVYLIAKDTSYALWRIGIKGDKLERVKLYQNDSFEYVYDVLPMIDGNTLNLLLSSSLEKVLYRLIISDFDSRRPGVKLRTTPLISESYVMPGLVNQHIYWVESDLSKHSYLRSWEADFEPVVNFNWRIVNREGYPDLYLSWQKGSRGDYEYRYILDKEKDSPPLPDYKQVSNNQVNFKMKDEGKYYLHLQARDVSTGHESPVYHLPVFWQYTPDVPDIALLDEISPRVISGKRLNFIIKNALPLSYYAEINKIPVYEPENPLRVLSGRGQISYTFEPGRYYLHIRVKDNRTDQYSQTLHYLFFYETMKLEQSVGLKEYNENLTELRMILEKIDSTRYDPVENARWRKRLKEFKGELEDTIEKPSKK